MLNKIKKFEAREKELETRNKAQLKEIVERQYRVVDLRDADKWLLISMVLEAEFGRKFVSEQYAN